jgi:hypothetical protein
MSFRLTGLSPEQFRPLFGKSEAELEAAGVARLRAQEGSLCRVTLEDAGVGENILLLTYEHVAAPSPYRSAGPIFVREGDHRQAEIVGRIPQQLRDRRFSIRAYDDRDWIVDSAVGPGSELEILIERFFENSAVRYLHLHHAGHGCFAARVDRP